MKYVPWTEEDVSSARHPGVRPRYTPICLLSLGSRHDAQSAPWIAVEPSTSSPR